MARRISDREMGTVLAALRYWQREGLASAGREREIATDCGRFESLSSGEIDALCERINLREVASNGVSDPSRSAASEPPQ